MAEPEHAPPVPSSREPARVAPPWDAPDLRVVLADARARLRRAALLEVVSAGASAGALALCGALVLVDVVPYSLALRAALWSALGAAALVAAALVVLRRLLPLRFDVVVAARLEDALARRGAPAGDAVRGAVELLDEGKDEVLGRSRALCRAHIAGTAARVVEGGARDSLSAVALERALPTLLLAAAALLMLVVSTLGFPAAFAARWDKLFSATGAQRALDERAASALPLVTDLKLTLRYPAYMGEPDEVIAGSSGDVLAPRGTEVTVEGRADRPLEGAVLLVGERELQVELPDARSLRARFTVEGGGAYRFRVDPARGLPELDPVAHKITVRPDAPPTVLMLEPDADRVVQQDETVRLAFSAKDDVGLTKFRVVVKRQGSAREPWTKDLLELPGGLAAARGKGDFTVAETGARPGDRLSVYVEALDNDTVGGPNVGRSSTRVLTVFSAAEQHQRVTARLQDVLDKMVDALGDELEAPVRSETEGAAVDAAAQRRDVERHRQIEARHAALQQALDEALLALAEDRLAPAATRRALANLKVAEAGLVAAKKRTLAQLVQLTDGGKLAGTAPWRRLAADQRALVERLEKDVLYLEDLLAREKIAEARQIADDLKRAQQDLKALIDQYKKSGDPEVRKALLDEIARMQKQMAELMDKLAALQRDVPDEFLNDEAFKGDELLKGARDIDQLIEEGKLDEAAAALERMLEQTQKMMEGLDDTGEQFGGDDYKELREKMQRFSDELGALEQGQRQVLDGSQALMDRATKEAEQRLKGKLERALAEVKKKVERAQQELHGMTPDALFSHENEDRAFAEARTEDLERALDTGDLEDAAATAEEAEQAARSAERSVGERTRGRFGARDKETLEAKAALERARQELESARKQLRELVPDPSAMMSAADRARLQKDGDKQEQLEEGAERLARLMDEIGKEAPVFGPEHKQRLAEAKQAMQRAGAQMKRADLRGARSSQRSALRQLAQLAGDLQQMGQGQGTGGGMPMPLPGGGSPGAEPSDREGNGRSPSAERVEIPDGNDFKVPDAQRKDIIDAMREGAPADWMQEVRRYYEKLIQ
ncbi:MAG: DUF4175 family protein [Deltaproteobacteria bacterium]|nr:DUF4175 family protein [Deltaproteobacteria bacterium]